MPILILALFIGLPIAEIALFIKLGGEIGLGWTLVTIFATAVIGTALVRQQGLQTMARARAAMDRNELPVGEVLTGLCILIAGLLLLTPGFLTDAMGFLLLIPPLRKALALGIVGYMQRHGKVHVYGMGQGRGGMGSSGMGKNGNGRGPIIDGEFSEVDPKAGSPNPNSPWIKDDRE